MLELAQLAESVLGITGMGAHDAETAQLEVPYKDPVEKINPV